MCSVKISVPYFSKIGVVRLWQYFSWTKLDESIKEWIWVLFIRIQFVCKFVWLRFSYLMVYQINVNWIELWEALDCAVTKWVISNWCCSLLLRMLKDIDFDASFWEFMKSPRALLRIQWNFGQPHACNSYRIDSLKIPQYYRISKTIHRN